MTAGITVDPAMGVAGVRVMAEVEVPVTAAAAEVLGTVVAAEVAGVDPGQGKPI